MNGTFGKNLKNFALSVDIVTPDIFQNTLELIKEYLDESLNIAAYGLLEKTVVGGGDGLKAIWHPGGRSWSDPIWNREGEYYGQVAYVFDKMIKLWVVAVDKKALLSETAEYKNLWAKNNSASQKEIPKFIQNHENAIRTAIVLPLCIKPRKPFGVLNLESGDRLIPTKSVTGELDCIAEAISILYELKNVYEEMIRRTKNALKNLEPLAKLGMWRENAIFLSSADNVDDEVISIIKDVINRDFPDVKLYYWKDIHQLGNAHEQIWGYLSKCRLGICYFAEQVDQSERRQKVFQYNLNVLYEAGMMQTLSKSTEGNAVFEWLPIREESLPNLFDIDPQRTVIIERDETGEIKNEQKLRKDISNHIRTCLEDDQI